MFVKQLTENTWMLSYDSGVKLGLVKKVNDEFQVMGKKDVFASLEEIAMANGEKLKSETSSKEQSKDVTVNGFPISHKEYFNVESHKITEAIDTVFSYNNSKKSEILYAAGYYGIFFSNQYVVKKSPKLVTILENEFVGPFKDEFNCKFAVSQKNKSKELNNYAD